MPGDVGRYAALQDRLDRAVFLGQELFRNAGWAGTGQWTVGAGWTVAGGTAIAVTVAADVSQTPVSGSIVIGRTYRVSYILSNVTAGNVRFQFTGGTNDNGASRNAAGVYSEDITITQTITSLRFTNAGTAFSGVVSAISLREVLSI